MVLSATVAVVVLRERPGWIVMTTALLGKRRRLDLSRTPRELPHAA